MSSYRVWAALGALVALWALGATAGPPPGHRQILAGRWFHAPVADSDCTACHTMHRNPVGPNLQAPVPELCWHCHEDLTAGDVVHKPVGGGRCMDCHLAHTSDVRRLLRRRVPELCFGCHPVDAHVSPNTLCTSCHEAHSSDTARLLKGKRTRNCGSCHADKREGASVHPPVARGKCLTCHYTHPDPRFAGGGLRQAYPRGLLAPYDPRGYALCDRCHPRELHADPAFEGTRFRSATANLHARHVQGDDGVSCSACHDTHASEEEALVHRWVRWPDRPPVPLEFARSEGGGACGPACHPAATYSREGKAEVGRAGEEGR